MVTFNVTVADECAAFDQAARAAYKTRLMTTLPGIEINDIYLRVTCGSMRVEAFIVTASVEAAADVQEKLATALSSVDPSSVLGLTVMAISQIAYGAVPDTLVGGGGGAVDDVGSSDDGGSSMLVMASAATSALLCVLLCVSCYVCHNRRVRTMLNRRQAAKARGGRAASVTAAQHGCGFSTRRTSATKVSLQVGGLTPPPPPLGSKLGSDELGSGKRGSGKLAAQLKWMGSRTSARGGRSFSKLDLAEEVVALREDA